MTIKEPRNSPRTEWSQPFLQGMIDRIGVSYHKYGAVADAKGIDVIKSLKVRLDRYVATGNTEWLMDVANYAMFEFMHPKHASAHFRATDSKESPGNVWLGTNVPVQARNDGSDCASV